MLVSVICPCRNEEDYIDDFVSSLRAQQSDGFDLEFLIADGQSEDGTLAKLEHWKSVEPRLKVLENPGLMVSTGLNRALEHASGEFIVRMDIHTQYAADYVLQTVLVLQETGADCVGGPWKAVGRTWRQKAVARAFQSRFASGGAPGRRLTYDGPVDSVYLGAWRKELLVDIGGFDEELVRNQDDELALRISRNGGTIWQSTRIQSEYAPRDRLQSVFKQYKQYGYWKVLVIRKHQLPASIRHLVPATFVLISGALAAGSVVAPVLLIPLGAKWALYISSVGLMAQLSAEKGNSLKETAFTGSAIAMMQLGYGVGFVRGLLDFGLLKTKGSKNMATLSR